MDSHDESTFGRFGPGEPPDGTSWSQLARLQFIDFRLRWEGRVNRNDLCLFFKISPQQATLDFAKYLETAPENLLYEPRQKAYLATARFRPVFARSASREYLSELLSVARIGRPRAGSFIGWHPDLATVPTIGRQLNGNLLVLLLRAIREQRPASIRYQAVRRAEQTQRLISPHALANDGTRWHVRAYCHTRAQFRDFVVSRVTSIDLADQEFIPGDDDEQWHKQLQLHVAPHPALPQGTRAALAFDYGMKDGQLTLTCRHAMLYYTLRSLGLLHETADPAEQQITLLNRSEILPHLRALGYPGV